MNKSVTFKEHQHAIFRFMVDNIYLTIAISLLIMAILIAYVLLAQRVKVDASIAFMRTLRPRSAAKRFRRALVNLNNHTNRVNATSYHLFPLYKSEGDKSVSHDSSQRRSAITDSYVSEIRAVSMDRYRSLLVTAYAWKFLPHSEREKYYTLVISACKGELMPGDLDQPELLLSNNNLSNKNNININNHEKENQ